MVVWGSSPNGKGLEGPVLCWKVSWLSNICKGLGGEIQLIYFRMLHPKGNTWAHILHFENYWERKTEVSYYCFHIIHIQPGGTLMNWPMHCWNTTWHAMQWYLHPEDRSFFLVGNDLLGTTEQDSKVQDVCYVFHAWETNIYHLSLITMKRNLRTEPALQPARSRAQVLASCSFGGLRNAFLSWIGIIALFINILYVEFI